LISNKDNKPKKPLKLIKTESKTSNNKNAAKKMKLIDSSSDDDDEIENEKTRTIKMFENKINLDQKKANQVSNLSKFLFYLNDFLLQFYLFIFF
jgi:hypothetical protein